MKTSLSETVQTRCVFIQPAQWAVPTSSKWALICFVSKLALQPCYYDVMIHQHSKRLLNLLIILCIKYEQKVVTKKKKKTWHACFSSVGLIFSLGASSVSQGTKSSPLQLQTAWLNFYLVLAPFWCLLESFFFFFHRFVLTSNNDGHFFQLRGHREIFDCKLREEKWREGVKVMTRWWFFKIKSRTH